LLGQVIPGWQKGIPLVKGGGSINLYIPPSLGYGANAYPPTGTVIIPGGSNLVFNVNVISIK
jgi:FKBP-type peptidyl-prolyl cis-trans isomerase FkpA